ncbi:MAG: hypothetical protein KTR25_00860 [Myxococcales bacterium]|nr:hypothetical protein [Myxococcales bacterium]
MTEYTSLAKAVSARLSAEVPGYTTFGPGAVAVQEVENAPLRDPLLILKESIQAVFAVPSPVDRGLEVSFNKRIKRLSEPCSCLGYRKYRSNLRFWVKKKQSDNASPLIDDSLPSAAENQGPFRLLLADLRYMSERGGALIENQFKWSLL